MAITILPILLRVLLAIALLPAVLTLSQITESRVNNRESSILDGNTVQKDDGGRDTILPAAVSKNVTVTNGDTSPAKTAEGEELSLLESLLPPGYNKLIIPSVNGSLLFVSMHLFIFEITDIDEEKGLLELDTEFGFTWIDWHIWKHLLENKDIQTRLLNASSDGLFGIDSEFLRSIWRPDVSIMELASVDTTYLLGKQVAFSIHVEDPQTYGKIELVTRQTLRVRCEMDFSYYPADTQKCGFNLFSWSYGDDEFLLGWDKDQRVYLDETKDPNYDFQVSDVEPGDKFHDYYTTYQQPRGLSINFSAVAFTIQVRRNLAYHAVQTFLPSMLLIMITWLCFLLPHDMVEARIGISMTTLLTIIAMFGAVREQAPKVSYVMAIDAWMVFCIVVIFVALVLFTVMYWLRQKFKTLDNKEAQGKKGESVGVDVEAIGESSPEAKDPETPTHKYLTLVTYSKRYAFTFFAVVFVLFLVVFGSWLVTASEYYSWDPSPTYNALDDSAGDGNDDRSNHIFAYHRTPYASESDRSPNGINGTFQADEQFEAIVKNIICERVLALNPNASCLPEKEMNSSTNEEEITGSNEEEL